MWDAYQVYCSFVSTSTVRGFEMCGNLEVVSARAPVQVCSVFLLILSVWIDALLGQIFYDV